MFRAAALLLLMGCAPAGGIDRERVEPTATAVACLPKGVYLGEALGATYTEAQKAAIDALRVINCPDPLALGYGAGE